MDTHSQHTDLPEQLNHVIAENESLKALLEEYLYIINIRDDEIENLHRKIAVITQSKSTTDTQLEELEILQNHIDELSQQVQGASYREEDLEKQVSYAVSTEHQLEDTKQQYTYLQTQLSDMLEQVKELNNRNLLLQQQTSHIAELESLLENAERENDELKNKIAQGE